MANQLPDDHPTIRAHKRQFAWQILAPVIVIAGLVIAGAVLVTTGGRARTGVWADVSLIWLLIPALLLAFVFLAVIITVIYGMGKILQIIPRYSWKAQGFFNRVSSGTRRVADGTTKPFFWFKEAGAVIKSIFRI
jgi:predicted membrane protein